MTCRDFTRSLLSFLQNPTPSKRDTLPPLFQIYKGERGKKDRIIEERKEEFISLYYENFEVSIYFDIYLLFKIKNTRNTQKIVRRHQGQHMDASRVGQTDVQGSRNTECSLYGFS